MVQWPHDKVLVKEVLILLLSTIKFSYGFFGVPIHLPHSSNPTKILVGFPSLPNPSFGVVLILDILFES